MILIMSNMMSNFTHLHNKYLNPPKYQQQVPLPEKLDTNTIKDHIDYVK